MNFPADAIIDTAKAKGCDLIVMASHGRRGIARALLGSQAVRVLTLIRSRFSLSASGGAGSSQPGRPRLTPVNEPLARSAPRCTIAGKNSRLEAHVVQDHPGASQRQAPRRGGAGAGYHAGPAQSNAHLIGMHVYASMPAPPVALAYGAQVLGSVVAAERQEAELIAAAFAEATANQPFVAEWRCAEGAARRPRRRGHGPRPRGRPDRGRPDRSRLGYCAAAGLPRATGAGKRPARSGHSVCRPLSHDRKQCCHRLEARARIGARRLRRTTACWRKPRRCRSSR